MVKGITFKHTRALGFPGLQKKKLLAAKAIPSKQVQAVAVPVAVPVVKNVDVRPVPQAAVVEKPESESSRKLRIQIAERTASSLITATAVESVVQCCLATTALPTFVGNMAETACEHYIGKESTIAKVTCIAVGTVAAASALAVTGAAAPVIGAISYLGGCALRYVGWSLLNGAADLAKSASCIFS